MVNAPPTTIHTLFNPTTNTYTSLTDPKLAHTIAHINEEHADELIGFLDAFSTMNSAELESAAVQLSAVYTEGIMLQVQPKRLKKHASDEQHTAHEQAFFIAFAAPITQLSDLQTQYILLKQRADKKRGKKTIKLTKQVFNIQGSYNISKNMRRLQLTAPMTDALSADTDNDTVSPIPISDAGYAYLFDLIHNLSKNSDLYDKIDTPRPHCYYTLRKAWHSEEGVHAWVDVFLHGDTSGGLWARSLKAGDTVVTKREFPEKLEHLQDGQALLIADETSLPTVARLLELWDNPKPPLVICITQDPADQAYLNEIKASHSVIPIVTGTVHSGQALVGRALSVLIDSKLGDYLSTYSLQIDKVWGGLEASTTKALRPLLMQRLGLSRTDMVVKVYWRRD